MKANVGKVDRIIRFILGIGILSLFFVIDGNLKYISAVGIVLIFTSLIKFCPLYPILGINTCRVHNTKAIKSSKSV
ncbi:DUF2892 domain-containing protein [Bacillaceae bacterium IKA-2]|nr:DUF2892 domain-containing protein [Bacillaceae bacterium IKA-2]